jgi:delta8-fatty-acid desaturase
MKDKILSRDEVEALIADGDLIVIHHDKALRLNNWIQRHPGGDKAVLHMVGRDASEEMDVYHSQETLMSLKFFQIGRVVLPWKNFRPPIQGGSFRTRQELEKDEGVALSDAEPDDSPKPEFASAIEKVIEEYDRRQVALDKDKYPPLDYDTQYNITTKFRELHVRLDKEGWFRCNYWGYVREASRISALFVFSILFFGWREFGKWWLFLSAVCLGLAWHQLTFIVHDAGHLGITHNYQIDSVIGIMLADFLGGLSVGWWKRNHNVHHFVTNDPVHDPDIQHIPFFAVSTKFFGNLRSSFYDRIMQYDAAAKMLVGIQNYTYYPILCFGRFNLYRLSWEYLILGLGPRKGKGAWHRYLEITGMVAFLYWFFYVVVTCWLKTASERWLFVMVSHVVTMPLHVQITLSHFAMSTSDLGLDESFAQRQVRTTMDVDCPAWFDYLHGGLQFQVIHHLFPRMPRHNFRKVQPIVIDFCNQLGLHYTIYGFTKGNKKVIGKLGEIAQQARILAECNEFCKEEILASEAKER